MARAGERGRALQLHLSAWIDEPWHDRAWACMHARFHDPRQGHQSQRLQSLCSVACSSARSHEHGTPTACSSRDNVRHQSGNERLRVCSMSSLMWMLITVIQEFIYNIYLRLFNCHVGLIWSSNFQLHSIFVLTIFGSILNYLIIFFINNPCYA